MYVCVVLSKPLPERVRGLHHTAIELSLSDTICVLPSHVWGTVRSILASLSFKFQCRNNFDILPPVHEDFRLYEIHKFKAKNDKLDLLPNKRCHVQHMYTLFSSGMYIHTKDKKDAILKFCRKANFWRNNRSNFVYGIYILENKFTFFWISHFFGLSIIGRNAHLSIKIGIVLVWHFNLWVEASTGGL
jgi:hypothetical protein